MFSTVKVSSCSRYTTALALSLEHRVSSPATGVVVCMAGSLGLVENQAHLFQRCGDEQYRKYCGRPSKRGALIGTGTFRTSTFPAHFTWRTEPRNVQSMNCLLKGNLPFFFKM